jgi:hypothetical protein
MSIGPPSSAGMDVLQRFAPPRHRNLLFSVKQAGVPLGGVLAGLLMPWASQALGIGAGRDHRRRDRGADAVRGAAACGPASTPRANARCCWTGGCSCRRTTCVKPIAVLVAMPALRRMGLAGGCLGAGQSAWFAFLVTYLVVELHWTLTAAGATVRADATGQRARPAAGRLHLRSAGRRASACCAGLSSGRA